MTVSNEPQYWNIGISTHNYAGQVFNVDGPLNTIAVGHGGIAISKIVQSRRERERANNFTI